MRDPRVSTIPVSGAGRTVSRASGSPELAGEPAAAEAMSETGPGDDFEPRRRSELASRVFNVVVALLMLTASLPVMLITALLIRLSSRGPVFYTQVRVGLVRPPGQGVVECDRVLDQQPLLEQAAHHRVAGGSGQMVGRFDQPVVAGGGLVEQDQGGVGKLGHRGISLSRP